MAVVRPLRRRVPRTGGPQAPVTPTTPGTIDDQTQRALAEVHPRYVQFFPRWQKYLDLYEGTNLIKYIHKHLRESMESLKQRQERLYYVNYCKPVVQLYKHYIFSKPVVRKETPEEVLQTGSVEGDIADLQALAGGYSELGGLPPNPNESEWRNWLRDVDRRGNSIDRFMADSEQYALIFGHVYLLVDMPSAVDRLQTEQDRMDQGLQPYVTMYYPTEAPDWGLDDFLRPTWIRFREPLPEKAGPFTPRDKTGQKTQTGSAAQPWYYPEAPRRQGSPPDGLYRTFTRMEWFVHHVEKGKVEMVNAGTHNLGEVPVVVLYCDQHSQYPFFGSSLISDIAGINEAILNWSSLVDEDIYQKVLNILCMQQGRENRKEIEIGSDNVLEYDLGTNAPFFLAPSTNPGQFIQSMVDQGREEIYRLAKLGGGLGLTVPQRTPSGIAQAFEFNETNRSLAERADEIERAENEVHRLWHLWLGYQWQGVVDYPDDFSVESLVDELDIIMKAKQQVRSPTFKRELEKKLSAKMMHNIGPGLKQVMSYEIDLLPELVMGPFGPMYYTPEQQPSATPTTAEEISRSPLEQTPEDANAEGEAPGPAQPGDDQGLEVEAAHEAIDQERQQRDLEQQQADEEAKAKDEIKKGTDKDKIEAKAELLAKKKKRQKKNKKKPNSAGKSEG